MNKLIIVGVSKTASQVFSFIKLYNLFEVIGFAVNAKFRENNYHNDLPVYTLENLNAEVGHSDFYVFVAIQWNHLNKDRRSVYEYCKSKGYKMANLISPNSIIRGNLMGDNCWIDDYVVIQNNVYIESDVFIKAYAFVGANSHVYSHCFLGVRSLVGGGSTIGEQSFIGLSATIFDDIHIGRKCLIGACTAVKRNMPDYSRYVTSSDNIVIKQYSEDEIESKLIFSKNIR